MKDYSRRITGVMRSNGDFCYINGLSVEELISGMLGEREDFPATISLCIIDLSEDSGVVERDRGDEV